MHPVVIMSYDKGPAISKAVAALEEAGMEVIVLNTKTAKLVQFLGALAGETDDEEEDKDDKEAPPADEPPVDEVPTDTPPEDEEPVVEESLDVFVNEEPIKAIIVEGNDVVLIANGIEGRRAGEKVTYKLNESAFSFWSTKQEGEALRAQVELKLKESVSYVSVRMDLPEDGLTPEKPVLKIGREWLKAHQA
jgi:hypothetical protein